MVKNKNKPSFFLLHRLLVDPAKLFHPVIQYPTISRYKQLKWKVQLHTQKIHFNFCIYMYTKGKTQIFSFWNVQSVR